MNKKIKEWEQVNSSFTYNEEFVYKQIKRSKRNTLFIKTMQICTCCITLLFVLVNTSESYVKATSNIPFLKDLNRFLDMYPTISIAIENDYVQELDIIKENGDFKVLFDKMVVDDKSIYLFYKSYYKDERIDINNDTFGFGYRNHEDNQYTEVKMGWHQSEDNDVLVLMIDQTYDFQDININYYDLILSYMDKEIIFDICVDEDKVAAPKIINVNQTIDIEGNKLEITKIEIYPLSMRIYTKQKLDNIALIRNIEFELLGHENEIEIMQWEKSNGQYMISLTSPYFYEGDFQIKLKSVELANKVCTATFNVETNEWIDPSKLTSLYEFKHLNSSDPYEYALDILTNNNYEEDLVKVDLANEVKYINIFEWYSEGNSIEKIRISNDALDNNKNIEFNVYKFTTANVNKTLKLK